MAPIEDFCKTVPEAREVLVNAAYGVHVFTGPHDVAAARNK